MGYPYDLVLGFLVELAKIDVFENFLDLMALLIAAQLPLLRVSVQDLHVPIYRAPFDVKCEFALRPSLHLETSVLHDHDVHGGKVVGRDREDAIDPS